MVAPSRSAAPRLCSSAAAREIRQRHARTQQQLQPQQAEQQPASGGGAAPDGFDANTHNMVATSAAP